MEEEYEDEGWMGRHRGGDDEVLSVSQNIVNVETIN